ncbi:ATP-dependent RecD-like DNA helicase [Oxobacter pfennigii]|uniref:ATP-dependent RecD2 DNA helicase n=1 Tax=Oxobacter pfennigii TaxID=36849 RepID=A0A0P8YY90_9CLOT|nr:ATP-dependent RecD-like DNA helicase [Oxobacter pfennigii]KPU44727.1 ATP-dependent RecD-like DNA helicase [Oxobacter pfennigii]
MVEIEGVIDSIVYTNESNGYTVARLKKGREIITVVGYVPVINEGQSVRIKGAWVNHPEYGQQLKIDFFEEVLPTDISAIEKYLASGLINGIGPATAKRMVDYFKEDTLDVIEYNPIRLTEVEGIGEKKAKLIAESFSEQRELKNVMVFLQTYGISGANAIKIYKKYGQNAINAIKENPYRLTVDVFGIGFKTADRIAQNMGIERASKYRLMAGIKFVLAEYSGSGGHTYLPSDVLIDKCGELLNVDKDLIEDSLVSLALNKEVVLEVMDDVTGVYLMPFYYSETGVSKRILEMAAFKTEKLDVDMQKEIEEYEDKTGIELHPQQKEAIKCAIENGVAIITGGPGTGKTTIIKCIINIMEKYEVSISLAAPTGRAAKRMTEATKREAKTIHRLLEMGYSEGEDNMTFLKDDSDPLKVGAVIIDEASMVDILLMNNLLKALVPGTRLIIVGDVDQLPSVGPGNVLRDLIESSYIPVVKLTEIFRQSEESLIVLNAHRINRGEYPYLNEKEKDFFFLSTPNQEDTVKLILDLVKNRIPGFKDGIDPQKYIQVLTPMRKGVCGVNNLNIRLQEILNPKSPDKDEKKIRDCILRSGDKVMQIKNNYNIKWDRIAGYGDDEGKGVFNGDLGYIEYIDNENNNISVIFDDERRVIYEAINFEELELAYAVTIHKSQGSEFPVIVMPAVWGPPMLMTRNLLYTGITRAKEMVVIAGSRKVLAGMVDNNRITKRFSGLKHRMEKLIDSGIFAAR